MSGGQLILISAPSGAGKTSLVAAALERDKRLVVSVSHTTRPMRDGETDGVNYHFVDTATFDGMVENQGFLEHANVFGNSYGTSFGEVESKRAEGQDVILEIDWQGAAQVREAVAGVISIFILPPSIAALEQRLTSRNQDSSEIIQRRLSEAALDISQAGDFDYLVVNDDFAVALKDLLAVIRAGRLATAAQKKTQLIQELLQV